MNNIIYIQDMQEEEKWISVYLANGTTYKAKELFKKLYGRLKDERFLLLHNEYIINMDYVKAIKTDTVVMTNNSSIPMRSYNRKDLINEFYKYKIDHHKRSVLL